MFSVLLSWIFLTWLTLLKKWLPCSKTRPKEVALDSSKRHVKKTPVCLQWNDWTYVFHRRLSQNSHILYILWGHDEPHSVIGWPEVWHTLQVRLQNRVIELRSCFFLCVCVWCNSEHVYSTLFYSVLCCLVCETSQTRCVNFEQTCNLFGLAEKGTS